MPGPKGVPLRNAQNPTSQPCASLHAPTWLRGRVHRTFGITKMPSRRVSSVSSLRSVSMPRVTGVGAARGAGVRECSWLQPHVCRMPPALRLEHAGLKASLGAAKGWVGHGTSSRALLTLPKYGVLQGGAVEGVGRVRIEARACHEVQLLVAQSRQLMQGAPR